MSSAKIASLTSSASPRTSGSSERPCSQSGSAIPASSQSVGKRSIWETSASETLPPRKPPGPRTISITPIPRSVSVALAPGNGEPVVGGEDHERVVGEAVLVERVQHRADALVERARAGLEGGHVAPRLRRVGQVGGRQRVERVAHRGRLEVLAVGLEEPDERKNGCGGRLAQTAAAPRGRPIDARGVDVDDVVVAEVVGVAREVLLADQRGPVAGLAQRVDEVVAVVGELVAAVGQPDHPVRVAHWPVSRHAREPEHVGAAQNAWRNSRPWSASRWMFGVGTWCP